MKAEAGAQEPVPALHFIFLVPGEGFEPSSPFGLQILSLLRKPVPPPRHILIAYSPVPVFE